jgi:hypothetical protein
VSGNRWGWYDHTEAERLRLMDEFDEVAYLHSVDAKALARAAKHRGISEFDPSFPSEAERCQSPDSAA